MKRVERPLSPHLQVYRPQITSVLSVMHRGTGVTLSLGAVVLLYWLVSIAGGEQAYDNAHTILSSGLFKLFYIGWCFCFFYHLGNGVRHLVWDVGIGLDRAHYHMSGWCVVIFSLIASVSYSLVVIL